MESLHALAIHSRFPVTAPDTHGEAGNGARDTCTGICSAYGHDGRHLSTLGNEARHTRHPWPLSHMPAEAVSKQKGQGVML